MAHKNELSKKNLQESKELLENSDSFVNFETFKENFDKIRETISNEEIQNWQTEYDENLNSIIE